MTTEHESNFQIAPMVDVVFVLLLFFMALAGIQGKEGWLKIGVPGRGGLTSEVPVVIDIDSAGVVSTNGKVMAGAADAELGAFESWTRGIIAVDSATPWVIRPSDETRHERFMRVMDVLHRVGATKVGFGVLAAR